MSIWVTYLIKNACLVWHKYFLPLTFYINFALCMWILSEINNQFHHLVPPSKKSGADDYVEELRGCCKFIHLIQEYLSFDSLTSWKEKAFFLIDSFWKILRGIYIRTNFIKGELTYRLITRWQLMSLRE